MNERLTRLFIIVVVAGLVAGVFKFALVQAKNGPGSIFKPMGAAVENFGEKVLVIQNMDDSHGSFEQVKEFGNVKLKVASNHDYPYFEEFNDFLI